MKENFPLHQIRLRGFKGVRAAEVGFRGLTLIAGANSSGKSTLVQAIASLHQMAGAGRKGRQFPLNGSVVSLGSFEDVLFEPPRGERPQEIGLGLTYRSQHGLGYGASYDLTLGPSSEADTGGADIVGLGIKEAIGHRHGSTQPAGWRMQLDARLPLPQAVLRRRRLSASLGLALAPADRDPVREAGFGPEAADEATLSFSGSASRGLGGLVVRGRRKEGPALRVQGAILEGGIPRFLLAERPAAESLVEAWLLNHVFGGPYRRGVMSPWIFGAMSESAASTESEMSPQSLTRARRRVNAAIVSDLSRYYESTRHPRSSTEPERLAEFLGREGDLLPLHRDAATLRVLREYSFQGGRAGRGKARGLSGAVERLNSSAQLKSKTLLEAISLDLPSLRTFLGEGVRHLGPLRTEPDLVYRQLPVGPVASVGRRGEYAAALLRMRGGSEVVSPPRVPGGRDAPRLLAELVDQWLSFLRLAEHVRAGEIGPLGFSLALEYGQDGRSKSPLSVGVGFSQALPVVMQCLLAEPGSVVLLEQPELHLHPAAQQRLADFFIACVKSGRQIIVETHSDHIVTRLRRLAAEDEGDEISNLVQLLFAEQRDGETTYREVKLSPFGALIGWPEGFFTDGVADAEAIIQAALRKSRGSASGRVP